MSIYEYAMPRADTLQPPALRSPTEGGRLPTVGRYFSDIPGQDPIVDQIIKTNPSMQVFYSVMEQMTDLINRNPNFDPLSPDNIKGWEAHAGYMVGFKSQEALDMWKRRIEWQRDRETQIAQDGTLLTGLWGGLFDPLNAIPIPFVAGMGLARGAFAGAIGNAAIEAAASGVASVSNPDITRDDIYEQAAMAAAFGGFLGGIAGRYGTRPGASPAIEVPPPPPPPGVTTSSGWSRGFEGPLADRLATDYMRQQRALDEALQPVSRETPSSESAPGSPARDADAGEPSPQSRTERGDREGARPTEERPPRPSDADAPSAPRTATDALPGARRLNSDLVYNMLRGVEAGEFVPERGRDRLAKGFGLEKLVEKISPLGRLFGTHSRPLIDLGHMAGGEFSHMLESNWKEFRPTAPSAFLRAGRWFNMAKDASMKLEDAFLKSLGHDDPSRFLGLSVQGSLIRSGDAIERVKNRITGREMTPEQRLQFIEFKEAVFATHRSDRLEPPTEVAGKPLTPEMREAVMDGVKAVRGFFDEMGRQLTRHGVLATPEFKRRRTIHLTNVQKGLMAQLKDLNKRPKEFRSRDDATDYLKNLFDNSGLTQAEKEAIALYENAKRTQNDPVLFEDPEFVQHMKNVAEKVLLPEDIVVYRGTNKGTSIIDRSSGVYADGFIPTSLAKDYSTNWAAANWSYPALDTIVLRKGTPVIPVSGAGPYSRGATKGSEFEILLPPGLKFKETGKATEFSYFDEPVTSRSFEIDMPEIKSKAEVLQEPINEALNEWLLRASNVVQKEIAQMHFSKFVTDEELATKIRDLMDAADKRFQKTLEERDQIGLARDGYDIFRSMYDTIISTLEKKEFRTAEENKLLREAVEELENFKGEVPTPGDDPVRIWAAIQGAGKPIKQRPITDNNPLHIVTMSTNAGQIGEYMTIRPFNKATDTANNVADDVRASKIKYVAVNEDGIVTDAFASRQAVYEFVNEPTYAALRREVRGPQHTDGIDFRKINVDEFYQSRLDGPTFLDDVAAAIERTRKAAASAPKDRLFNDADIPALTEKMHDYLTGLAQRYARGDLEFKGPPNEKFYLPRKWLADKVLAGRERLRGILSEHFRVEEPQLSSRDAAELADSYINSIIDGNFIGSFDPAEPMKSSGKYLTSYRRARELTIPNELVKDFIETDIDDLMHGYVRTAGVLNEHARAFGNANGEVAAHLAIIEAIKDAPGKTGIAISNQMQAALWDFRDLRDSAASRLRQDHPLTWDRVTVETAKNAAATMVLGKAAFTAMVEAGRPIMTRGVLNALGTTFQMFSDFRAVRNMHGDLRLLSGEAMDIVHGMIMQKYMEMDGAYSGRPGSPLAMKLDKSTARFNNVASTLYYIANGLTMVTDFLKTWDMVLSQHFMLEDIKLVAKGTAPDKTRTLLATYGIGESMAQRILDTWGSQTTSTKRLNLSNVGSWTDLEAREAFVIAVAGEVRRTIVTPGPADKSIAQQGFISYRGERTEVAAATLPFQLHSYGIAATSKVMLSALQGRDQAPMIGVLTLIGIAYMTNMFKMSELTWQNTTMADKIALAVDRSGALGIFGEINNIIEGTTRGAIGIRPMLGLNPAYNIPWEEGGPAEAFGLVPSKMMDIYDIFTDDNMLQNERNGKIRRLWPGNNVWFVDRGFKALQQPFNN